MVAFGVSKDPAVRKGFEVLAQQAGIDAAKDNEQRVVPDPWVNFSDQWRSGYDSFVKGDVNYDFLRRN
ncbi:hypothetical protein EVB32_173 [Rhizobium phage RHph_TM39]|uniref:Uncharacterized protein n=1 Tax=Rhizobium phage RHph_TM30 TaxID=2509764 RepID=A0A7S5RFU7_9CAUD|nr:hypothetical protein PQC16_gp172 [Rhizobium phage RHph_TM30]QIG71279.1 hypothetical protein EVB93_172 [Rhizobium phage RHph_TM30]QIG72005.1 hypothetical protein EVB95_171 [Rhizobium phage RHph_TM2_3B]QIG72368.1 hypothetical protein EVB96_172 [Rhizobium phage RHph_TM3_3_6]QIG77161.1 hypothetical protein EVB32_173 [Rhizobium phage RHph_TM39]